MPIIHMIFEFDPPDSLATIEVLAASHYWLGGSRRKDTWLLEVPLVYQSLLANDLEFPSPEEACAAIGDAFGLDAGAVQDSLKKAWQRP